MRAYRRLSRYIAHPFRQRSNKWAKRLEVSYEKRHPSPQFYFVEMCASPLPPFQTGQTASSSQNQPRTKLKCHRVLRYLSAAAFLVLRFVRKRLTPTINSTVRRTWYRLNSEACERDWLIDASPNAQQSLNCEKMNWGLTANPEGPKPEA